MGMPQRTRARGETLLAGCVGFAVIASDGVVGVVETPLFPPDAREPDFLVLRIPDSAEMPGPHRPIVSVALVQEVDPELRIVRLGGRTRDIVRLPEHVPIARAGALAR
jgi:hypothetical protein